jgi:uncharacterized protein YdeI (YjbR/CyaY-like superfamily)
MKLMNPKPDGEATEPTVPAELRQALAAAPLAEAAWRELTPIARRDFATWIDSAKQPETRRRRIARACENIAAGKRRPCCYAVVPMDFYKAIGAAPMAKAQWGNLTPTKRRDLIDWIESAEGRETRKGRIKEACAMLAAGNIITK